MHDTVIFRQYHAYMSKLIEQIKDLIPLDVFTETDFSTLFPKGENSRYGTIKRAIAKGEIVHLRRGLYCLAEKYRRRPLNLFMIAQKIYGPSYISFESALSYHGLIPEAVRTTTSATIKRSRDFTTPVGVFSFTSVPARPLMGGVERCSDGVYSFFMASPLKAIADYVCANKKNWDGARPLVESLRIDEEFFGRLSLKEIEEISILYASKRISKLMAGLKKDVRL